MADTEPVAASPSLNTPDKTFSRSERAGSAHSHDSRNSTSRRDSTRSDRDSDRRRRRDSPGRVDDHRDHRSSGRRDDRDRDHRRDDRDRDDNRDNKRRRSRSRDRDNRSRRDDDRSRPRNSPPHDNRSRDPPRRRSPSPPEQTEEEREMRSVFVSQLAGRVTDRELGIFFDVQAGKVREAKVITDRISRRSKGVGYVEFIDLESVQKALGLTGTRLMGIPILVQYTEAEKNRQARDGLGQVAQAAGIYVGSLNFALTESDLRQVFQPFGEVVLVDLHKDGTTGKSKGFAFVQFKDPKHGLVAVEKMNNFNLAGREIKVGIVAEKLGIAPSGGGGGGGGSYTGRQEPSQLDDGTGGGNLNNISRIELMQKLSRSDRIEIPSAPLFRPNIPTATSRNILLRDAFNPEEETERDWDIELRDDVKGEVEQKYGKVAEIFVVKASKGEIYIRFETIEAAIAALAGLNGRWFGGRQISCGHVTDPVFDISH